MDVPQHEPSFSLHEFRSWLNKHQDAPKHKRVKKVRNGAGDVKVESRLGLTRLNDKIVEHNSDLPADEAKVIAETFKANGGVMKGSEDMVALLDVEGRTFKLPSLYIRASKEKND